MHIIFVIVILIKFIYSDVCPVSMGIASNVTLFSADTFKKSVGGTTYGNVASVLTMAAYPPVFNIIK